MQVERFEDVARDDHLAALPHAPDPLLGCGRLGWHAFSYLNGRNCQARLANGFVYEPKRPGAGRGEEFGGRIESLGGNG